MERTRKIAIIDDDEIFHIIIEQQLKRENLDCELLKFCNGLEAMTFFKTNINHSEDAPDLVLLDLNMPVMNGWEFIEEYGKLQKDLKESVSLYMITSSLLKSDIGRADDNEDIKGFVSKPLTNDKLKEIFFASYKNYKINNLEPITDG